MKKVFTNSMTCHVWAQQSQDEGRNGINSIFFTGSTIYRYSSHFWIGHFVKSNVVLLNSSRYSITTSDHQSLVSSSLPSHLKTFNVPEMDPYRHETNLKYLISGYESNINLAKNAKRSKWNTATENASIYFGYAEAELNIVHDYAKTFKLKIPKEFKQFPEKLATEIIEAKELKDKEYNTPKNITKREKQKEQRRKLLNKKYIQDIRFNVKQFRTGQTSRYISAPIPILLRLNKDNEVQTSQGATISIKYCKAIWLMVCKCKASKTEYISNGKTIHAGLFKVDSIKADGTLHAGCHTIKYGPIKYIARKLDLIA